MMLSVGFGTTLIGFPTSLNIKYVQEIIKNLNIAFGYFWVGDLFNVTRNEKNSFDKFTLYCINYWK